MSRLQEIIDNHHNLDQLFSVIRHYGVSAEFVSDALLQHFENRMNPSEDSEQEGEDSEEDKAYMAEMIDDLKQFAARF